VGGGRTIEVVFSAVKNVPCVRLLNPSVACSEKAYPRSSYYQGKKWPTEGNVIVLFLAVGH